MIAHTQIPSSTNTPITTTDAIIPTIEAANPIQNLVVSRRYVYNQVKKDPSTAKINAIPFERDAARGVPQFTHITADPMVGLEHAGQLRPSYARTP